MKPETGNRLTWRYWPYVLAAALTLTVIYAARRQLSPPRRTVTRTVAIEMRSGNPKHVTRQTYYIMALRNEAGEDIATATRLITASSVVRAATVANDGHGLWSDVPAMGAEFALKASYVA